jgi:hypothetical protein
MEDAQQALLLPTTNDTKSTVNIFGVPDTIVRLRPMGFTGFNIADVTEADIGAAAPIHAVRVLLGFAGQHDLAMSISVPNAEYVELPAMKAFEAFQGFCAPDGTNDICNIDNKRIQLALASLRLPDDTPDLKLIPKIVMVTQVYYARQLDYSYTTKGGAALALSAAAAAAAASNPGTKPSTSTGATQSATGAATPASVNGSTSPATGTTTTTTTTTTTGSASSPSAPVKATSSGTNSTNPSTLSDAEQEIAALRAQLDAIKNQLGTTGPAGSLQVLTASSQGTTLRQTFDIPIAIGYRGLWILPVGVDETP